MEQNQFEEQSKVTLNLSPLHTASNTMNSFVVKTTSRENVLLNVENTNNMEVVNDDRYDENVVVDTGKSTTFELNAESTLSITPVSTSESTVLMDATIPIRLNHSVDPNLETSQTISNITDSSTTIPNNAALRGEINDMDVVEPNKNVYGDFVENVVLSTLENPSCQLADLENFEEPPDTESLFKVKNDSDEDFAVATVDNMDQLFPSNIKKVSNKKSTRGTTESLSPSSQSILKELRNPDIENGQLENSEEAIDQKNVVSTNQMDSNLSELNNTTNKITELKNNILMQLLSKEPKAYKMLAIQIYLKCPKGYKILQKTLGLPQVSELKSIFNCCPVSTDNNTLFASVLQYKSEIMSLKQKECIICIGTIDVKKHLFYDIRRDKLAGVYDIDRIQKPETAVKVLVMTMQGMYTNWTQFIDIACVSAITEDKRSHVDKWIKKNIANLLKVGLNIRAIVCETDYLLTTTSPSCEMYKKIYYTYDIASLLRCFLYVFLTHDYIIGGEKTKMQHIWEYIELDSKNEPRLSPNISEQILRPDSIENLNIKDVLEVINTRTAAAMTVFINLNLLSSEAKSTVKMIMKMSLFSEVLCSNKSNNLSKENDKQVLRDMISFFDGFIVVNNESNIELATEDTFVPKFQSTIKAFLMLHESTEFQDGINTFSAQRLSLRNVRIFFDRIKQLGKNRSKPTSKTLYSAFRQSALSHLLKPPSNIERVADLEFNLDEIKGVVVNYQCNLDDFKDPDPEPIIKCSEYNKVDFNNKDSVVLIAGFVLKKCYENHLECAKMKNYTFIIEEDSKLIRESIQKEIEKDICVLPQENFIEFVEMMEIRLRSFFSKEIIETRNGFIKGLLKSMESVTFQTPCPCFPMLYAKQLYLRARIRNILLYNNNFFASCTKQMKDISYLIVNDL